MKGLNALENLRCMTSLSRDCSYTESNDLCDIIEKELKDYQEIREIAKRYNWEDITSKIFNVESDKKYRDLFNSAIVNIQEDYRKARAFEIIKAKQINFSALLELDDILQYNDYCNLTGGCEKLTQEEYDLLKEALE